MQAISGPSPITWRERVNTAWNFAKKLPKIAKISQKIAKIVKNHEKIAKKLKKWRSIATKIRNITRNFATMKKIKRNHKKSRKITKNHEKSQKNREKVDKFRPQASLGWRGSSRGDLHAPCVHPTGLSTQKNAILPKSVFSSKKWFCEKKKLRRPVKGKAYYIYW